MRSVIELDEVGQFLDRRFDERGRLIGETDLDGQGWDFFYDEGDNLIGEKGPDGTFFVYDRQGWLMATVSDGAVQSA